MKKIDRIAIFVGFVILLLTMFIFNSILISRLPKSKEEKLELKIGESYKVEYDYGGFNPDIIIVTIKDMVNSYLKIENDSWRNVNKEGWYKKGMFNWYKSKIDTADKIRFIKQVERKGIHFRSDIINSCTLTIPYS